MLRLEVANRVDHLPGQHYVIRLTADDGYVAQRSYSIASAPADPLVELWIERLEDGEVSGYLADVVEPGDELAVRGPIGGWFVWDGTTPAAGVGGGSGAVPLVAMLRHAADVGRPELLRLAVSARTLADLPYPDELAAAGALIALSRTDRDDRKAGRLTVDELRATGDGGRDHLRLRVSRIRRVGQSAAGRTGLPGGGRPGGAVRAERLSLLLPDRAPAHAGHRPLG